MSETTLTYQVFVAPIIAIAGKDVPPGQSRSTWSPISATLISGRHDAVLVDPLMTVEQGMAVADWVSTTGKNLTTVYVTHGHGDHWFGLSAVRERFPRVRAVATPAVIERMRKWSAPEALRTFWQPRFPGQIPDDNPRVVNETRQYIREFDRRDKESTTPGELYGQLLAIYPDRVNPGALWLSAQSVKAGTG